jgi:hypothetical protein
MVRASLLKLNTRIACSIPGNKGSRRSQALGILVEYNIAIVLNKLALAEHAVNLCPSTGTALELDTSCGKALLQRRRRRPAVDYS